MPSVSHRPPPRRGARRRELPALPKAPSGIRGLDEITGGGLPRGRPTLVCGGPGCGKTLFAIEFLVRGATDHGEPGVLLSFEESEGELAANVASLGFDVTELVRRKKLAIDHVKVERAEIEETGEFNLEGLFVRLQHAIESVGAKRVALDTVESLFAGLPSPELLRSELRRLFRWLKDRGLTVVITGEKGEGTLTRAGLEEYVSDCVIFLDHRVVEQVSTRRLRVVKYRGSTHGTNEYPFLIDEGGISVLPITSLAGDRPVHGGRVPTGLPWLDEMLGGAGLFRGTACLLSGSAGTGKTSIAASVAVAACARGERCLLFSFEESAPQLARNLRSIGLDLAAPLRDERLRVVSPPSQSLGMEMHLLSLHRTIEEFRPAVVVIDPVTSFVNAGTAFDARSLLTRLVDYLRGKGITAFFTSLSAGPDGADGSDSEVSVSSLVDAWIRVEIEGGEDRRRILRVVKARGMAHPLRAVEFRMSRRGLRRVEPPAPPADGAPAAKERT